MPTIQCFYALRCWTRWFRWIHGRPPYACEFSVDAAKHAWARSEFENNIKVNKVADAVAPAKFKSFKMHQWRTFYDSVIEYVSTFRGVTNLPLTYLIRPQLVYSDAEIQKYMNEVNPTYEALLMRMIRLDFSVPEVAQDNLRLYALLAPLIHDTDAYVAVATARRNQDGRALWLTLVDKGDGGENRTARHWAAHQILRDATLDESNRGTSQQRFDNFTRILQQAFNELDTLGEPVSAAEQVRVLVLPLYLR